MDQYVEGPEKLSAPEAGLVEPIRCAAAAVPTPAQLEQQPSAPSAQPIEADDQPASGDAAAQTTENKDAPEAAGDHSVNVVPDNIGDLAIAEGEAKESSWFSDAVLIGDSRMDGFRLYSGTSEADYIVRAGMTVWEVAEESQDISVGGKKYSAYQILGWKQYAKVYLSIGINELGYYNPTGYAETYGKIIDQVRQLQPDAQIYVMTLIPVNTEVCRQNKQKSYINNDMIRQYNDALITMVSEKNVLLLNPVEIFADENGELIKDMTSDGVHFKKDGYTVWKEFLLCHTGT